MVPLSLLMISDAHGPLVRVYMAMVCLSISNFSSGSHTLAYAQPSRSFDGSTSSSGLTYMGTF